MYLDIYIGFFDGSVDKNGHDNLFNNPRRKSPLFPSDNSAFRELKSRIASGAYPGWPLDWGAWVAKVSRQEILAFIEETGIRDNAQAPHLKKQYQELLAFIDTLKPGEKYALIASEL